ncbi:MAG: DUF1841 family protein [Gammaproteobacteria bacterium]
MSSDDQKSQQGRDTSRRYFVDVWQKYRAGSILQPLENLIAGVIIQHPEYHDLLEDHKSVVEADFDSESGAPNPFLHMGLHITLQEQYGADRPAGIRELYDLGLEKLADPHLLEHRMMESLGEVLWRAQRDQTMPNEEAYLEGLRQIVGSC